jgi:hypothetical protein
MNAILSFFIVFMNRSAMQLLYWPFRRAPDSALLRTSSFYVQHTQNRYLSSIAPARPATSR